MKYKSLKKAQKWCKKNEIYNYVDYQLQHRLAGGKKPLPENPPSHYDNIYSWREFFNNREMFTSLKKVQKWCKRHGIRTEAKYLRRYMSADIDDKQLPKNPCDVYENIHTWDDFFNLNQDIFDFQNFFTRGQE